MSFTKHLRLIAVASILLSLSCYAQAEAGTANTSQLFIHVKPDDSLPREMVALVQQVNTTYQNALTATEKTTYYEYFNCINDTESKCAVLGAEFLEEAKTICEEDHTIDDLLVSSAEVTSNICKKSIWDISPFNGSTDKLTRCRDALNRHYRMRSRLCKDFPDKGFETKITAMKAAYGEVKTKDTHIKLAERDRNKFSDTLKTLCVSLSNCAQTASDVERRTVMAESASGMKKCISYARNLSAGSLISIDATICQEAINTYLTLLATLKKQNP